MYSRSDLSLLLPLLAAAKAGAQSAVLPSKTYSFDQLLVHTSGENQARPVRDGETHFAICKRATKRSGETVPMIGCPARIPDGHQRPGTTSICSIGSAAGT